MTTEKINVERSRDTEDTTGLILPDGRVLVTGGTCFPPANKGAELYEP